MKWTAVLAALCLLSLVACFPGQDEERMQEARDAAARGDFAEAYCLWKPLAEHGNAEAQYSIGWLYANGDGVGPDATKAVHWWEQAAGLGHADSQYALAVAYATGDGIPVDKARAVEWYLRAAQAGHEEARHIVRRMAGERDPLVGASVREILRAGGGWLGPMKRIAGDKVNLRSAPSTKADVLTTLRTGATVVEITRRGKWTSVGVTGDGEVGWVHTSLLKASGDAADGTK